MPVSTRNVLQDLWPCDGPRMLGPDVIEPISRLLVRHHWQTRVVGTQSPRLRDISTEAMMHLRISSLWGRRDSSVIQPDTHMLVQRCILHSSHHSSTNDGWADDNSTSGICSHEHWGALLSPRTRDLGQAALCRGGLGSTRLVYAGAPALRFPDCCRPGVVNRKSARSRSILTSVSAQSPALYLTRHPSDIFPDTKFKQSAQNQQNPFSQLPAPGKTTQQCISTPSSSLSRLPSPRLSRVRLRAVTRSTISDLESTTASHATKATVLFPKAGAISASSAAKASAATEGGARARRERSGCEHGAPRCWA